MTFATVEVSVLLKVVGISLVASLVLALAYSLCLYGGLVYAEHRRAGRGLSAIAYGALAVLGGATFVGALVLGLIIMTSKG